MDNWRRPDIQLRAIDTVVVGGQNGRTQECVNYPRVLLQDCCRRFGIMYIYMYAVRLGIRIWSLQPRYVLRSSRTINANRSAPRAFQTVLPFFGPKNNFVPGTAWYVFSTAIQLSWKRTFVTRSIFDDDSKRGISPGEQQQLVVIFSSRSFLHRRCGHCDCCDCTTISRA